MKILARTAVACLFVLSASAASADPSVPPKGAPDPQPESAAPPRPAPGSRTAPIPKREFEDLSDIRLKEIPPTYCDGACSAAAEKERQSAGSAPPAPAFRPSMKQSTSARNAIVRWQRARGKKQADAVVFKHDQMVSYWRESWPKGTYRDDDLADVLTKFWIFSFAYTGGVDPDAVTDKIQATVRSQFHGLAISDPVLSNLSEAQRQALAEKLMRSQAGQWMALMLAASTREQLKTEFHNAVASILRMSQSEFRDEFGYQLTDLAIAPNTGFVLLAKK